MLAGLQYIFSDPCLLVFTSFWAPPTWYQGWSIWPREHRKSDNMLLLRLSHTRLFSCHMVALSFFHPSLCKKPAAMSQVTRQRGPCNGNWGFLPTARWVTLGADLSARQAFGWMQPHGRPWARTAQLGSCWIPDLQTLRYNKQLCIKWWSVR